MINEVFFGYSKQRSLIYTVMESQNRWTGHALRGNSLLGYR